MLPERRASLSPMQRFSFSSTTTQKLRTVFLTLLIRLPHYESSVYEQIEEMEEQLAPLLDSTSDKFLLNTDFQPIIEACQQQTVE